MANDDLDKAANFLKAATRALEIGTKGIELARKMKANHAAGRCANPVCRHPDESIEPEAPLGLCEECFVRAAASVAKVGRSVKTR